ncbi:putative disease resistance protein RGA3 isoform X2 [Rosa chinensis]|uniref:putative disease resistance protein RGA3 isoform X2 n=1 Tax=Rosa chinensis TaxID=74649 RepID=UPI001AD9126E|nr:putative disease resistance protein RGA3 isoform X2 [Rosa chinensis]
MTIVSSLLLSAAGGAVGNVASLATDQLSPKIFFCFRKELDKLKQSSDLIGSMIRDAAPEPEDREPLSAMARWKKELVTVAYAAEDVVDEVQYEFVRIDLEGTILCKDIRRIFVRLQMACKIGNINKSLDDLYKQAAAVGLTRSSNGGASSSQGMQGRETTSLLEKHEFTRNDAIIVGRDEVVSNITATLTNPNNQEKMLLVMAVVGLAGLGKTTLARSLTKQVKQLKEGEMKEYFDITLWVYVSKTFDVKSILRRMLKLCEETTANPETLEELIPSLCKKLKGKRYFLVLDDVWNEVPRLWKILEEHLQKLESAKGSTVIVTTRSGKVAEIMGTLPNCYLGTLSDDQCWSIIQDRAFNIPNPSIDSEQERIGRKIAEKCAGVPLAAKILGSLMHSKNSNEWNSILESPTWQNQKDSEIMPVLKLSFDNLESPLKLCFAYCSMLDMGSLIEKEELIQLWMAQGFLNPSPGQRTQKMEMEDIGNEYFDTLLQKSLFQDATKDEDDVITECKMHDLVHEFAIEVSKCESWTPNFNQKMDHSEIRHVARIPTPELQSMSETSIARLRSLFSNVQVSNIIFSKLRSLRVLSFYGVWTQKLPNSLDKLKHLRYLDLSRTKIKELPESIGKLYNLQTLRLPYLDKCPKEIQNLINLRHLDLSRTKIKELPESIGKLYNLQTLRLPWYLDKWPKEIQNLINLRHLDLSRTKIKELPESIGKLYNLQTLRLPYLDKCPKEIQNLINLRLLYFDKRMKFEAGILGRLTDLRTLRNFNVGKEIGDPAIEELSRLNQLRGHLAIDGLEHVRDEEEAKNARLVQKSHLHELTFKWTHGGVANENQTDVLDGLEPHGELQRLNIENFMGARFPSWIMSLQNLKEIRLVGCNNCEGVPTLGHLPKLRSLKISKMHKLKRVGAEFYGTRTTLFPALKTLDISECKELIEWMEAPAEGEVVVFPCLEELKIRHCPNLGNAPSRFPCLKTLSIVTTGLTCLPEGMLKKNTCLKYLSIGDCDELTCIAPDVFGCCESLRSLVVILCKKLSHLPDGLDKLPLLEQLRIERCPSLKSIRITRGIASLRELNIESCEGLSSLEVGLQYCTSLQELKFWSCPNLMSIPITQCMPSLRTLDIRWCERLSSLGVLDYCTSLQKLVIENCDNLTSIPITEGITSLQSLRIVGCQRLLSLPSGLQFCTSLQYLQITRCYSLVSISVSYHVCDHQDSTNQREEVFTGLVQYLSIPAHLRQSLICNCGKLKYEPTGFHRLTRLKKLTIGSFWRKLDAFPDFQLPPPHDSQLEKLELWGWPKLKSLPQQIQHYTSLKTLRIQDFDGIEALPEWLGNLTSLETLTICLCWNLESLPTQDAMKSLTKLKKLSIYSCPLLEKRCTKETDPEWPKISHIPKIEFDCSGRNMHAANLPSSTRNAENLTSSRRNAVLDCLPCCIL